MQSLVEEGHLYIAQPPLYSINKKNKKIYFYTDEELAKFRTENPAIKDTNRGIKVWEK